MLVKRRGLEKRRRKRERSGRIAGRHWGWGGKMRRVKRARSRAGRKVFRTFRKFEGSKKAKFLILDF